MRYTISTVLFAAGALARVTPRGGQQCYQLQASGGASGVLGQLDDGQNRVGGGHPTGCYCLSNGGWTDTNGRGCILTPPTTQFQCDVGASPTGGFSIGSNGMVMYNGNSGFWACPVNDYGEWNVYSQPAPGQKKCVQITVSVGAACGPSAQQPSPQPQPQPSPKPQPQPSPQPQPQPQPQPKPSSGCPADLNGNYQYPHLIVPINSQSPNQAYGTSYFGKVDQYTCSIFNFDIPSSYSGNQCTLIFLFPTQSQLQTSSYQISGSGSVTVSPLSSVANQQTTWNSCPSAGSSYGSWNWQPGNSYTITTGSCAAGTAVSYKVCASGSYSLNYFQDYNPSPIGLYIRQC